MGGSISGIYLNRRIYMKVILTENIDKVGKAGQVINVKDGYARNYLLPKKFAIIATAINLKKISNIEADQLAKTDKKNEEYRQMAKKIADLEAVFTRRADQEGKLFGSVSELDIVNYLSDNEINCNKNQVDMESHIKNTGDYDIKIAFTTEISALLKVKVEASE